MNKEWLDQAKIEASKFWKPLQGGTKHPVVTRKEKEKKERRNRTNNDYCCCYCE